VRKNDECYPRPERDAGEKESQKETQKEIYAEVKWICYFDTFQHIPRVYGLKDYDVSNLNVVRRIAEALPKESNMSAIPPVLPNRDELSKVNEVGHKLKRYPHLERCYSGSDSAIAELRKFYSEIAHLRGEEGKLAFEQGVTSLKRTIEALKTLERIQPRAKKVLSWVSTQVGVELESGVQAGSTDQFALISASIPLKKLSKLQRINTKIQEIILKSYDSISDVATKSWDYLPTELHEALESLAQRIVLCTPEVEKLYTDEKSSSYLSERLLKLKDSCNNLVLSVFSAIENGRGKPKLQLLELFRRRDLTHGNPQQEPTVSLAMAEIQELIQNLAELSGVSRVEAIAHNPEDLHRVTFALKLSADLDEDSGFEDTEDLWEIAERMAFRAHKRLRESTDEKWYFNVVLDDEISDYPNSNYIIASAHAQSDDPHSAS
jgi:hypothetical protein